MDVKVKVHTFRKPTAVSDILVAKTNYDVVISCQDGAIQAHRLILACGSSFIKALLNSVNTKETVIILPDTKCHEMNYILDFLYKGSIHLTEDQVDDVTSLINTLQINCDSSCDPNEYLVQVHIPEHDQIVDENQDEQVSYILEWDGRENSNIPQLQTPQGITVQSFDAEETNDAPNDTSDIEVNPEEITSAEPSDPKPKNCEYCTRQFLNDDFLQTHMEKFHPFRHNCSACLQKFATASSLKEHQKIHRTEIEESIEDVIDQSGTEESNYDTPVVEEVENERTLDANTKSKKKSSGKRRTSDKLFMCNVCKAVFHSSYELQRHQRAHTGERPFKCSYCDTTFRRKEYVKKHETIHTGEKRPKKAYVRTKPKKPKGIRKPRLINRPREKSFECVDCLKLYYTASDLTRHRRVHTGERPFSCSYCNKVFRRKEYVTRHERSHTGEKTFPCATCGKIFTSNSHCQEHLKIHTGIKPFACDVCGQMFKRRSHLKEHQLNHLEKKPFECSKCGKGYNKKAHCAEHEQTHEGPVPCQHCGKNFKSTKCRLAHEKLHSLQQFLCVYCGKGFGMQKEWRLHEKAHADGENMFTCNYCEKMFKQDRYRIMHEKNKHTTIQLDETVVEVSTDLT